MSFGMYIFFKLVCYLSLHGKFGLKFKIELKDIVTTNLYPKCL